MMVKLLYSVLTVAVLTYTAKCQIISLLVDNIAVAYNNTAILNCTVEINATLTTNASAIINIDRLSGELLSNHIRYYYDDVTLILEIFNSEPSDEGDYQCSASVEEDELNITFTLTVEGFQLQVINPPTNINQSLGGMAIFSCTFNYEVMSIQWEKNNKIISTDVSTNLTSRQSMLHLTNLNFNDMATYKCVGKYRDLIGKAETYLRINEYIPLYINETANFVVDDRIRSVVRCDILGVPSPIYTWKRNGDIVPDNRMTNGTGPYVASNGSLILVNAMSSDTGIYECIGRDNITGMSISIYYNITIYSDENVKKEPLSWYIIVIAAIIGITLVLMFTIACYFIAANSDICYNKEKLRLKKMEKKMRKQLKSQEIANDEFGFYAPHILLEQELSDDDDETELISNTEVEKVENEELIHTTITEYTPHTQELKTIRLPPVSSSQHSSSTTNDYQEQMTFPPRHVSSQLTTVINIPDVSEQSRTPVKEPPLNLPPAAEIIPKETKSLEQSPPEKVKSSTKNSPAKRKPKTRSKFKPSAKPSSPVDNDPVMNTGISPAKPEKSAPSEKPKWTIHHDETPKQSDGMFYMETVYIPPVETDDENDDDFFYDDEISKGLIPKALKEAEYTSSPQPVAVSKQETSPLTVIDDLSQESESSQMASESITIHMDQNVLNDDNEEEEEDTSEFDLEKIIAQHTATENDIWPWKGNFATSIEEQKPMIRNPLESSLQTAFVKERRKSDTLDYKVRKPINMEVHQSKRKLQRRGSDTDEKSKRALSSSDNPLFKRRLSLGEFEMSSYRASSRNIPDKKSVNADQLTSKDKSSSKDTYKVQKGSLKKDTKKRYSDPIDDKVELREKEKKKVKEDKKEVKKKEKKAPKRKKERKDLFRADVFY